MVWSEFLRLNLIFMNSCGFLCIGYDFYELILEVALDFYSRVMISISLPVISTAWSRYLWFGLGGFLHVVVIRKRLIEVL